MALIGKSLSKSSAAVTLFLVECGLPREATLSRAELRALDSACRKLDALFVADEHPIVTQPNGSVGARFAYEGDPVLVEFDKSEHAVIEKYLNLGDRKSLAGSVARAKTMLLEKEWGCEPEPEKVQEG